MCSRISSRGYGGGVTRWCQEGARREQGRAGEFSGFWPARLAFYEGPGARVDKMVVARRVLQSFSQGVPWGFE